jgi:membrane protein DedA with SNARE-associated domain
MTYRTLFGRLIIVSFLVLVGYSLARSIQYKSFIGILLALTSLGASIYFLYLLAKTKQEMESETEDTV